MAKVKKLSTYDQFVKGIKDFEKSESNFDSYYTMLIATSNAFRGGVGLGDTQIREGIEEALKGD